MGACVKLVKPYLIFETTEKNKYFIKCREEKEAVKDCVKNWLENDTFKRGVTLEYLNERSHYRQTGVKSKRYRMSNFVKSARERDGPPLDEKGNYRPQKPQDWEKYYKDGLPKW